MTEVIKDCKGCLAQIGCAFTKYSTLCPCTMCIVKVMCTAPSECDDFHAFVIERNSYMNMKEQLQLEDLK